MKLIKVNYTDLPIASYFAAIARMGEVTMQTAEMQMQCPCLLQILDKGGVGCGATMRTWTGVPISFLLMSHGWFS